MKRVHVTSCSTNLCKKQTKRRRSKVTIHNIISDRHTLRDTHIKNFLNIQTITFSRHAKPHSDTQTKNSPKHAELITFPGHAKPVTPRHAN